jgi:hypothetical protein
MQVERELPRDEKSTGALQVTFGGVTNTAFSFKAMPYRTEGFVKVMKGDNSVKWFPCRVVNDEMRLSLTLSPMPTLFNSLVFGLADL